MVNDRLVSRLKAIDWDFSGSFSQSRYSAIHWHPGRYASQLAAALIGLLSRAGDTVLDPFVGSGTTIVESQRLGRPSIGIDLNPISCLVSTAKTLALPAKRFEKICSELIDGARAELDPQRSLVFGRAERRLIPSTVQQEKWYTPRVAGQLARLWAMLSDLQGPARVVGQASFSAILLAVCRETRHWGYVCDNTEPQSEHEGNVLSEFRATLAKFISAYKERDEEIISRGGQLRNIAAAKVHCGDAIEYLETLPHRHAKLVVTSPPYFGVCDYSKAQRLSMEWFSHDIEQFRLQEIGARSKRHRKNALVEYVSQMEAVLERCRQCLRNGGNLAMIIGQSQQREAVLEQVKNAAKRSGLHVDLDLNRRVSSQRRQHPSIRGEHILIMSKA